MLHILPRFYPSEQKVVEEAAVFAEVAKADAKRAAIELEAIHKTHRATQAQVGRYCGYGSGCGSAYCCFLLFFSLSLFLLLFFYVFCALWQFSKPNASFLPETFACSLVHFVVLRFRRFCVRVFARGGSYLKRRASFLVSSTERTASRGKRSSWATLSRWDGNRAHRSDRA